MFLLIKSKLTQERDVLAHVFSCMKIMNEKQLIKLNKLISEDKADSFYHWSDWERLRKEVLKSDHYECQICKSKGRYSKAVIVHHVKHLKDRPDLALSKYDDDERQLISVCKNCHEDLHPEQITKWKIGKTDLPLTVERWD